MKTFVIDSNKIMTRGCLVESGQVLRYDLEVKDDAPITGNIYKGRITNINHQKRIGFIDIGLEKNGMINFKDVTDDVKLVAGQEVLVQVISDPYEEKGAKLTTELSFQGRYMVLLSGGKAIAVSRKIEQEEKRKFLQDKLTGLIGDMPFVGAIVRTDAASAQLDDLVEEYEYLSNQLKNTLKYRVLGSAPRLIRENKGLIDQYKQLFNKDEDQWLTNDKEVAEYSVGLLGKKSVQYYAGHDLFDYAGCKQEIERLRARYISLPSGGELVVDYTEACVVIDVNSGKQRKGTPSHDVLFKINCEAMEMTRWLLEKGNIGGAIIVDLINMNSHDKKEALLRAAKDIFKGSNCYIAGISALGFLEITRKRLSKPSYKLFEFTKYDEREVFYKPNMLYYINMFVNEVRRLTVHHSGRHYKFFATPTFIEWVRKYELLSDDGKFYENKEVTIEFIEDGLLALPFKITY